MCGTRTTVRMGNTELENQTGLLTTAIQQKCQTLLAMVFFLLKLMLKLDWQFGEVGT